MKANSLFLCCLAAAPLVTRAGDPVVLEGPAESTKAELDQCATALARRFAVAGIKGLKATAVEKAGKRTVEVTSKDAIPVETRSKIEDLAGQKPVLKFQRDLTAEWTLKEATITFPAAMAESLEAVLRNPKPRALKTAEAKK